MANFINNGNGNFNNGNGYNNYNNGYPQNINGGFNRQQNTMTGGAVNYRPNLNLQQQQMGYPQQGYNNFNQQPMMQQQYPQQQQQLNQQMSQGYQDVVNFKHNDKDEIFFQRMVETILINGLSTAKEGITRQRGYTCTFRGNTFGITINLIFDQMYKHLQPFVINANKVAEVGIGTGEEINEQFLSKATFLGPQISSLRDNYGRERTMNQRMVAYYVDQLSSYIDAIGDYINKHIRKDARGNYVDSPELQAAASRRFRYSCINITPIVNVQPQQVVDQYGRVSVINVPNISFVYSLTEASTLRIKQDVAFM